MFTINDKKLSFQPKTGMSSPQKRPKKEGGKKKTAKTQEFTIPIVDLKYKNQQSKPNYSKKNNKVKMSLLRQLILIIILTNKQANSIKVLHASRHISIHAVYGISDVANTENIIDKITNEIRDISKNTKLKEKGEAFSHNIESMKRDWRHQVFLLLTKQKSKRGFKLLGDIFSQITETASPDEWVKIKKIASDLTMITSNQQNELKNLKKQIFHNKNELNEYLDVLQTQRLNEYSEISNAIYTNENLTELSVLIDIAHIRAITIINHGNNENKIIQDIFEKSLLHLPSKNMFNPNTIKEVITKNAESDKKNSHVFFTEKEIFDLYKFQSTMTAYDKDNNTLHSLLYLPLADYSDQMTIYPIPNLSPNDLNRLHALEDMTRLRYDRIQCSKGKNTISLLATSELRKCQSNIEKDTYICSGRQLTLKMNKITSCQNIKELPKTLASQTEINEFVIQSSEEKLTVYCEETPYKTIFPEMCPIKIFIPSQCHIKSKSMQITKGETSNLTKVIQVKDMNLVRLTPLKHNDWTHIYKMKDIAKIKLPNKTNLDESKDLFDKTDQIIKKTKSEVKELNESKMNMHIGISSLTLAITSLIVTLIITGYLAHKATGKTTSKTEINTQIHKELIELKTRNDEIESRIKTIMKNELREYESEIESRLTNKIKQEILESIITKSKKDNYEETEQSEY
jgi:hypothetical protein